MNDTVDTFLIGIHWTSTVAVPAVQGFAADYPMVLPAYVAIGMVVKLWMLYMYTQRPAVKSKLESWGISIP